MTFLLAPKRKLLKVVCSQYTFSLPNSGNCYFKNNNNGLSKWLPESDLYLPRGNRASAYVAPCYNVRFCLESNGLCRSLYFQSLTKPYTAKSDKCSHCLRSCSILWHHFIKKSLISIFYKRSMGCSGLTSQIWRHTQVNGCVHCSSRWLV